MAAEVKVPRLGQGMESGTIVKWLKSEGDAVKKGEPLYELDTDKVTQEVEAEAAGVLLKIAVPEGEVPVGTTIAFIGEQGESLPDVSGNGKVSSAPPERRRPSDPPRSRRPRSRTSPSLSPSPRASLRRGGRASASRPRRSRAGSHASAASTSRRSEAPAPRGGSSPRISTAPPRRLRGPPPFRAAKPRASR